MDLIRSEPLNSGVYVIQQNGGNLPIKVGFSRKIEIRMKQYKEYYPNGFKIHAIAIIENAIKAENYILKKLRRLCIMPEFRQEWFKPSELPLIMGLFIEAYDLHKDEKSKMAIGENKNLSICKNEMCDFSNIQFKIGDVTTSQRGQKSAAITDEKGVGPALYTLGSQPLVSPWGLSSFGGRDDEKRQNLEIEVSGQILNQLEALEKQLKSKSEHVDGEWSSFLKKTQYGVRLRGKVNIDYVKLWNSEKERITLNPKDVLVRGSMVRPAFTISKIWSINGKKGVTIEFVHIVVDQNNECPF